MTGGLDPNIVRHQGLGHSIENRLGLRVSLAEPVTPSRISGFRVGSNIT